MELNELKKQIQNWIIETISMTNSFSNEEDIFISPDFNGIRVCLELEYITHVPDEELPVYLNSMDEAIRVSVIGHPEYAYIKYVDAENDFSYLTDMILEDMAKVDYEQLKN